MRYRMRSQVWQYPGMAGWFFLTLPQRQSDAIKKKFGKAARGWGSLPITATIGKTSWKSSIFPDRRTGAYLLPLKAAIRKKENIAIDDPVTFTITLRV